jgi:type II secretory pathway pseudopilin PulG
MSSVKCPQCNLTNWATAINCKRCGYFFQPIEGIIPESQKSHKTFGGEQNFQTPFGNQEKYQSPGIQPNYQSNWSPPNYQNYQPNYQQPKLKSGLAIASMVIGIIGFVGSCIGGFILTPIGLILGIVALVKANKKSLEYGGKGFAIAGTVLNSIAILFMPIILAIAIPNLLAARQAANEGSAISVVRTIAGAEQTFRATTGKGRCGDLKTLQTANLIDTVTASGQKNGYSFMVINLPTLNGDCAITATPLSTSHGTRSFYYSTEDDVLRAADKKGLFADSYDLPLESENRGSTSQYSTVSDQKTNPYSR